MLDKKQNLLKNISFLLRSYKKQLSISFFCTLLITASSMLMPVLTKELMDDGIISLHLKITIKYVLSIIIILIIEQGINFMQFLIHMSIKNDLSLNLSSQSFKKLLKIKISYFHEHNFTELINNVSFNIDNIVQIADRNFVMLILEILKIIGGLIGLFIINFKLTLCALCFIPIKYVLVQKLAVIKISAFEKLLESIKNISFLYGDILNNVEEVKLWNMYEVKHKEYIDSQKRKIRLQRKLSILDEINCISNRMFSNVIINMMYIAGVILIMREELTVGGLLAFVMYCSLVIEPISLFLAIKYELTNIKLALNNYIDFMALKEEQEKTDIKHTIKGDVNFPSTITFKGVSLSYHSEEVLKNISITFNRGEKVAFFGTNGSGKTSIINLLLRFYEPQTGKIYMDGVDVQDIEITEYRELFASMNQQTVLFNAALKDNLTMGENLEDKELIKRFKKAGILELISFALKEKRLEEKVGHRGSKLSGGEKQKVALARTLLKKNSKILIFDEATSNCDRDSETIFNKLVKTCQNYDFMFVITHRQDILEHMDKIVILDRGKIKCILSYEMFLKKGYGTWNTLYSERGGEVSNG